MATVAALSDSIDEPAVLQRSQHPEYDTAGESAPVHDFVEAKRLGRWNKLEDLKRANNRSTEVAVAVRYLRLGGFHDFTFLTGAVTTGGAGQQGIAQKVRRMLNWAFRGSFVCVVTVVRP